MRCEKNSTVPREIGQLHFIFQQLYFTELTDLLYVRGTADVDITNTLRSRKNRILLQERKATVILYCRDLVS